MPCRRNPCYTTETMSTPEPELRWYQFSLRSLLLFAVFVALLCSLGVSMGRGYAAAAVVNVLISGFVGRTVAKTWSGLVLGCVSGSLCACAAAFTCAFFWCGRFGVLLQGLPSWECMLAINAMATIGSLIGGVLGGFAARHRSQ